MLNFTRESTRKSSSWGAPCAAMLTYILPAWSNFNDFSQRSLFPSCNVRMFCFYEVIYWKSRRLKQNLARLHSFCEVHREIDAHKISFFWSNLIQLLAKIIYWQLRRWDCEQIIIYVRSITFAHKKMIEC